jgi:hypothetical protein
MTENLTKEKIEQLAPDQASLGAALKLMKPASWPMLSRAIDASLLGCLRHATRNCMPSALVRFLRHRIAGLSAPGDAHGNVYRSR